MSAAPLSPGIARQIRRAVAALGDAEIARLAASAFSPEGQVARWAEVVFFNPAPAHGAFAAVRERDDGNGRPGREFTIDAAVLRRGLRRAIESAVALQGVPLARAIDGHLAAADEPAIADRVVQFAIFESDTEVYYTGAGVES